MFVETRYGSRREGCKHVTYLFPTAPNAEFKAAARFSDLAVIFVFVKVNSLVQPVL